MAKTILVTGANGHIGHHLLPKLKEQGHKVIALDIEDLSDKTSQFADEKIQSSILDTAMLATVTQGVDTIYHLASILAVPSELDPEEAHTVNATGTVNIYKAALEQSKKSGKSVQVIFPSSIAVYGLPDVATKESIVVTEEEYVNPLSIYGITKLYCEQLGTYFATRYKMLDDAKQVLIDFRALRLPGVVTEFDEGNEIGKYAGLTMVHSPAESGGFEVFVKGSTVLPFIKMDDAIKGLLAISEAPQEKLTRHTYNISGFASTVSELTDSILKEIPEAKMSESIDPQRQALVDSWPQAIDDSKAKEDWGWNE